MNYIVRRKLWRLILHRWLLNLLHGARGQRNYCGLIAPPKAAFAQATELLQQLGALSADGQITTHGRKMADVGLHPRLSHMIVQAISLGYGNLACEIAALLGQRDLFQGEKSRPDADLRLRIEALRHGS